MEEGKQGRPSGRGWRRVLLLGLALGSCSTPPPERDLLGEYRRADFGDKTAWPALDDSYRNRIALEFEIIRSGRIGPLREALRDPDPFVRSFSAAALGILGDHASEGAIAKMVADPGIDPMSGGAAVQALGWLKAGREVVQSAKTRSRTLNRHLLDVAAGQIEDSVDHAAMIRESYRLGIRREEIGSARTGKPAPEFTAVDTDGRPFSLADAVRKNPVVVLVFVSADW